MSAGLNGSFADWLKLATFGDPELEKLVNSCAEWAQSFKANHAARWLTITGQSGTGKTHCARKLFRYAAHRSNWQRTDYLPAEVYWPSFVKELRDPDSNARTRERDMQRWPVLFLDDIGAERDATGFAIEALNTLLGCRVNKWTILTANLTLDELHEKDRRIASRIVRPPNICVGITTQDYAERANYV